MTTKPPATSPVVAQAAEPSQIEALEDVDEPPEPAWSLSRNNSNSSDKIIKEHNFMRTPIRRANGNTSLLTQAIMQSDEDAITSHGRQDHGHFHQSHAIDIADPRRRRSMASNVSVASTADLTSDTGLTSPARTNTPSPPTPDMARLCLERASHGSKPVSLLSASMNAQGDSAATGRKAEAKTSEAPRKRCIQFACAAKPTGQVQPTARPPPLIKSPPAQAPPKKSCIKFACPMKATQAKPSNNDGLRINVPKSSPKPTSPSTPKRLSALSARSPASPRSTPRRHGEKAASRPKYLRANSADLSTDGSQFHAFASDTAREDDWIRQEHTPVKTKLTINDTLVKENNFRRLATEAEEEDDDMDDDEDPVIDEDDDENEDEDEDDQEDDEDDEDEDDFEDSDGYNTDEETGFADSDDEEDEDENMMLWTPGRVVLPSADSQAPIIRRTSVQEQQSDSSTASASSSKHARRSRGRRIDIPSEAHDLPDSTDFVCGTLDEDRPLEEAFLSSLAAKRNEKRRIIPQDIDPSFPASEPEDEEDEEIYNPVHHDSDTDGLMHGEMDDLHHGQDRSRRRKKSEQHSPRRFHSPPPKQRHHSPPPRARARSPKPLFERHSPRKMRSPPRKTTTPRGSLVQGREVDFHLAARPGPMQTKSLPRAGVHFKTCKSGRHYPVAADGHIRGAIDIVKGLEKKRQRRKEKFHQKYCDRARRGQIPERKPQPGRGAERMKELGLLMAGKKEQKTYVISI